MMCHRTCVADRRDLLDWFTDVSMYRIMCDIDTDAEFLVSAQFFCSMNQYLCLYARQTYNQ